MYSGTAVKKERTGEILAALLKLENRIIKHTGLAPNDDISTIRKKLEKTLKNNIVIVGHLPYLSHLAAMLLAGDERREIIRFQNAGIVCLVRENSSWQLAWMITPELIG
ncbi:hypothetical protein ES703_61178 [subsurface metagenome]